jgi:hypothetical protein
MSVPTRRRHAPAASKAPLAPANDSDPFEAEFQKRAGTEKRAPLGEAYGNAPQGQEQASMFRADATRPGLSLAAGGRILVKGKGKSND